MKKVFFSIVLFCIFSNVLLFAQNGEEGVSPYVNLKLENGEVFYEKVYPMEGRSAKEIEQFLVSFVPRAKYVTDFTKTDGVITAKIKDCLVDYKRYGGSWGNTLLQLNHPMFATVTILWKDDRYKVTVAGIYWDTAGMGKVTASEAFSKKRGTVWSTGKIVTKGGEYVDRYLIDLFYINPEKKSDW